MKVVKSKVIVFEREKDEMINFAKQYLFRTVR